MSTVMGTRAAPAVFRFFYASFVVSALGDAFRLLAVNVWIFVATEGSTTDRLVLVLLANVPGMVLGGVSGVLADRWDKYTVLISSDLLRMGVGLGLAWCALESRTTTALLLVAVGNGLGVFFATSSFALLPRLMPGSRLPRANGLMETGQWVVQIVGPALAALTLAVGGASFAFLVDTVSFAVSAVILWQLRRVLRAAPPYRSSASLTDDVPPPGEGSPWGSFVGGVRVIWQGREIRALLFASYGVAFVTACTNYTLIFLVADTLSASTESLGFIYSLNGAAAVVAATAATALLRPSQLGRVMAFSMLGLCTAQVVMGLAPNLWVLGVGVVLSAVSNAPYNVAVTSLYMKRVPPEYLGRVEGVDSMVDNTVRVVAFGVALLVISVADPRAVFLVSAAVALPSLIVAAARVARSDGTAADSEPSATLT